MCGFEDSCKGGQSLICSKSSKACKPFANRLNGCGFCTRIKIAWVGKPLKLFNATVKLYCWLQMFCNSRPIRSSRNSLARKFAIVICGSVLVAISASYLSSKYFFPQYFTLNRFVRIRQQHVFPEIHFIPVDILLVFFHMPEVLVIKYLA